MDNESDVDVRIMSEQRKGVYSDSVKERPIISTVEKVVGKTMPTPAKARKILREWFYLKGGKGKQWSEAELKQFKSEFTKLSLIEMCQVHNRNVRGVLEKAGQYMAIDFDVKKRTNRRQVASEVDDIVKNAFTATVYGLCVNTQRKPSSIIQVLARLFETNQSKTITSNMGKQTSRDARFVIPSFLQDDFDKWVKSDGVKIYLEHIETEFRRLRKSVH